MNYFFDTCFPKPIVGMLRTLATYDGLRETYEHLEEALGTDPGDPVWIPTICGRGRGWVILTVDEGRRGPDRVAWESCTLPVLRICDKFAQMKIWEAASYMITRWARILDWARSDPPLNSQWRLRVSGGVEKGWR